MIARLVLEERGMTIVEGVVACLVLTIGALASLQLFDTATRATFRAEESQTVANRLQAELEEVKSLPFGSIALTSVPSDTADHDDPRWRISGSNYAIEKNGDSPAELIVDADNGAVSGASEPFQVGDISGEIYKFIVWRNDSTCPSSLCPGNQDLKRVIVAARVDEAAASFPRAYQEIQGDIADPDATPVNNPAPPGSGEDGAVAEFWLTDTPCSFSTRQDIVADHPAHNTRARCEDGHQTGNDRGAPDLMFTEAPALDPDFPPGAQPMYDYATDSEPATNPTQDKGLLMPWTTQDSCVLEPVLGFTSIGQAIDGILSPLASPPGDFEGLVNLGGAESNKQLRVHTWVTPEVSSSGAILTGGGSLEIWSRTVNGAATPGAICVSLFVRQVVDVPVDLPALPPVNVSLEVDMPLVNTLPTGNLTYFRHQRAHWPRNLTEVSIPLQFAGFDSGGASVPLQLSPGNRIGMSLMVPRTGTDPGAGLEFMYDHPSFDSRLELDTNEIIGF